MPRALPQTCLHSGAQTPVTFNEQIILMLYTSFDVYTSFDGAHPFFIH